MRNRKVFVLDVYMRVIYQGSVVREKDAELVPSSTRHPYMGTYINEDSTRWWRILRQ